MPKDAGRVDIGVLPSMNRKSAACVPLTARNNLSKIGHNSTPKGLSIVGSGRDFARSEYDMVVDIEEVCPVKS
jgi:hypothetical protein